MHQCSQWYIQVSDQQLDCPSCIVRLDHSSQIGQNRSTMTPVSRDTVLDKRGATAATMRVEHAPWNSMLLASGISRLSIEREIPKRKAMHSTNHKRFGGERGT